MLTDALEDGEQLFDTENEEVEEAAIDSDVTGDAANAEEEQEQALNLDEEQKVSSEADGRAAQVNAWQKKIDNGEVTIEDLPPAQRWMKEHLKPKGEEVDHKAIARELAKEAIREERELAKFENLKEDVLEADVPRDKKRLLEDKFKLFRGKGLSKLESLELAIEAVDVDLSGNQSLRRSMRLPKPGVNKQSNDSFDRPYSEVHKSVPEKKRQEYLKSLVQN